MTYNDLYATVTQYKPRFQRLFPAYTTDKSQILAWFWSNPYAKPNNDELTHNKNEY